MTETAEPTLEILCRMRADHAQGLDEVKAAGLGLTAQTRMTNAQILTTCMSENRR